MFKDIDTLFVVKVTVTLYPKEGYSREPVVITRSYLPTYRADPLYPRARLDENELSTINTD